MRDIKVRLTTLFAMELVSIVLANELHIALVTAPPTDANLTAVPFAETRLCAVFFEGHAAASKEHVTLEDFANDEWILLPRNVNATIHDPILETAARTGIPFRQTHGVINAEQAFYLVSERAGVAILPKPSILGEPAGGVVVRTLSDPALSFETCLIMRRDDDCKLVNQYARAFIRKYVRKLGPSRQMDLPLSA
jgi:DNA-binding transcriptional LysR family regulator